MGKEKRWSIQTYKDFKNRVNKCAKSRSYLLPHIGSIFAHMQGTKAFSSLFSEILLINFLE
jgi:hypothetical protein